MFPWAELLWAWLLRRTWILTDITQKRLWAEFLFLWAKTLVQAENPPGYHDINTEDPAGRIPMGERSHEEKTLLYLTSTQKTLMGRIPMGETLAQEENPGYHDINTEDSMGRIPMGETLTWRKSTAPLTSTQKTLWAEFLWAKRSHEEKTTAVLTSTPKYHGQKRLYKQKTPDSYDANTEDTMGRIHMGETLVQEKKPLLSWHLHRRLHGQNSYGRNAHMKKIPDSNDVNTEDTMGRIPMGETLTWRKPTALLTSARKTPWAEFLWANAHMKKNHGSTNANTEDTMGRIPMGETLVQNLKGHLMGNS